MTHNGGIETIQLYYLHPVREPENSSAAPTYKIEYYIDMLAVAKILEANPGSGMEVRSTTLELTPEESEKFAPYKEQPGKPVPITQINRIKAGMMMRESAAKSAQSHPYVAQNTLDEIDYDIPRRSPKK